MRSVNKVILVGNVVQDPQFVQVAENVEVCKFTIALNEQYRKNDGEEVQLTTYIDCEAWGGLTKVLRDHVKKGSRLYIEGNLRSDKWTDADTGKSRTRHKVRVIDLLLLDSRRSPEDANLNESGDSIDASSEGIDFSSEEDDLPF